MGWGTFIAGRLLRSRPKKDVTRLTNDINDYINNLITKQENERKQKEIQKELLKKTSKSKTFRA